MPETDAPNHSPDWLAPVAHLPGVGPRLEKKLQRLGIARVQDVLFHLPLRYQDRTRITPMVHLQPGQEALVEGRLLSAQIRSGRRRSLVCTLSDGAGLLGLRFFNFSTNQAQRLEPGSRLRCFGDVRLGPGGREMVHPEYRRIDDHELAPVEEALTPLYPTTEGVHQSTLRRVVGEALHLLEGGTGITDWLPRGVLDVIGLPDLVAALHYLHRPPPDAPAKILQSRRHPAQRRLAFEELLAHNLSLTRLRQSARLSQAPCLLKGPLLEQFVANLPFKLTKAQGRVIREVQTDLAQPHPMLRLVQGDVGSGKTVIAAMAALQAVEAGYQAAVMAPTEILAEQHYDNFRTWLQPLGIVPVWIAGRLSSVQRREVQARLAGSGPTLAIGTHALIQQSVNFERLALAVIDEQHRFGVHQRLALPEKATAAGWYAHQLIMTATPIPRTLAMTAYADLDCSTIDELPPGRRPVSTAVLPEARRDQLVARVRSACTQGQQVYWVCTLIDESEALQCQAAEDTAARLAEAVPEARVALVHGRMNAADKEAVMAAFKGGEVDLLVATTVIEVGVDVPNASLMVIENAERLGLSQLHQLRGRVGRGRRESHCVLVYRPPLTKPARTRLAVMRETNDGFEIANRDLALRGAGEVLGTRQAGVMQLRIADLTRDADLLPAVHTSAAQLLTHYPERVQPLIDRWLGGAECYGRA